MMVGGYGAGAMAGAGAASPSGSQVGLVAAEVEPPPAYPASPLSGYGSSAVLSRDSANSLVKTGTPLHTETPGVVPD